MKSKHVIFYKHSKVAMLLPEKALEIMSVQDFNNKTKQDTVTVLDRILLTFAFIPFQNYDNAVTMFNRGKSNVLPAHVQDDVIYEVAEFEYRRLYDNTASILRYPTDNIKPEVKEPLITAVTLKSVQQTEKEYNNRMLCAATCLQGLLAAPRKNFASPITPDDAVKLAVQYADKLLKQLEHGK